MAFFDKLNDFAKNISDKTTDAIETGKLSSRINSEKNLAGEELKKIGEHYYNLWLEGGKIAPEVLEFCSAAKGHYDAAQEAQAEIDRIRAENEAAKAAAAAAASAAAAQVPAAAPPAPPAVKFCTGCGAELAPGVKFCGSCGTRTE